MQADIFDDGIKTKLENEEEGGNWDIVISNPPYISPNGFNENTSRSVRNYEPKIALVPSPSRDHAVADSSNGDGDSDEDEATATATSDSTIGDSFYPQILKIASRVQAKMVLMEVSDLAQAKRVASLGIRRGHWVGQCEIWRDWPDEAGEEEVEGVELGVGGQVGGETWGKEGGEKWGKEKGQEDGHEEGNETETHIADVSVRIIGKGHGRSVFFSSFPSSPSASSLPSSSSPLSSTSKNLKQGK